MGYKIKTVSASYPVTLSELKEHLRLPAAYVAEDNRLNFFIQAATRFAENYTNRMMIESSWYLYLNSFPKSSNEKICFLRNPIISITSIKYKDESNVEQTWLSSCYALVNSEEPAYVKPVYGEEWPSAYNSPNSITIEFKAGYSTAAEISANIKAAIFMICADLWSNRETIIVGHIVQSIPRTAEMLLELERIPYHEL